MQKTKNNKKVRQKAVCKYKRQRTIVNKMLELAKVQDLKMSLLVYDPKKHKLQEIVTDEEMKLSSINDMMVDVTSRVGKSLKSSRILKFESQDARLKYKQGEKQVQSHDQEKSSYELQSKSDRSIDI